MLYFVQLAIMNDDDDAVFQVIYVYLTVDIMLNYYKRGYLNYVNIYPVCYCMCTCVLVLSHVDIVV